jgi:hypothetical protein
MYYAINLFDWTARAEGNLPLKILIPADVIDREPFVVNKARMDETAVRLVCDEERATAIVGLLRKKYKPWELRCYQSKTGKGSWKRI